jgi:hypothetical protein
MIKITNATHWDNELIKAILIDAGVNPYHDVNVNVRLLTKQDAAALSSKKYDDVRGACYEFDGAYQVLVAIHATLETLAHELKHVEQEVNIPDFDAIYQAESTLEGYDNNQWEHEARVHGTKWLNMGKGA